MNLSNIVPWGRSFGEYRDMFALSESDLKNPILGCGDGPASFNAEATLRGAGIISVDPIYAFTAADIEARVAETFDTIMPQTRSEADAYIWERWSDPAALGQARLAAMRLFLADYERGKREGRYRAASLPTLPFPDGYFGLALCSHLLFLYSSHLSADEHLAAMRELLRVAKEVRVFPLFTLSSERSPYLADLCAALWIEGYEVEEQIVGYEFRRGGNRMLRARRVVNASGSAQ